MQTLPDLNQLGHSEKDELITIEPAIKDKLDHLLDLLQELQPTS